MRGPGNIANCATWSNGFYCFLRLRSTPKPFTRAPCRFPESRDRSRPELLLRRATAHFSERVLIFERAEVLKELELHGRNISQTAKALGLERSHLYKKLPAVGNRPQRILRSGIDGKVTLAEKSQSNSLPGKRDVKCRHFRCCYHACKRSRLWTDGLNQEVVCLGLSRLDNHAGVSIRECASRRRPGQE